MVKSKNFFNKCRYHQPKFSALGGGQGFPHGHEAVGRLYMFMKELIPGLLRSGTEVQVCDATKAHSGN
jgi:hypothetical protein